MFKLLGIGHFDIEFFMQLPKACEILIIGGGLAGAMAGYQLAQLGYDVLLLEREQGAHHKVCGEFLSPETLPYFAALGLDLDILGAVKITGLALHSRHFDGRVNLSEAARGLSRFILDEACLKLAASVGCQVRRGVDVGGLTKPFPTAPFIVQTSQGHVECQTVFLATGKHALKGINHRDGRENSAIAFKIHVQLSEENRRALGQDVALFFFRGGYAGLSAVESGLINLCFIVNRADYKRAGNSFEAVLQTMKQQNPQFKQMLDDSEFLWPRPLALANLPYGYVLSPRDASNLFVGLYPLGDQFAVIPSLTGSGMAIALYTAHTAALHYHLSKNAGVHAYAQKCSWAIGTRMKLAYPMHALTRFPLLADVTVGLLKFLPQLAPFLLAKTRMPVLNS